MVIFGIIFTSLVPKCSIIGYIRFHLGFSDLLWCLIWKTLFGIILVFSDPKPSIMSDGTCLVLASLVSYVAWIWWLFWASFWHHDVQKQASSETRVVLVLGIFGISWFLILLSIFRHNFCIMRFKSRHNQRPELPWFWHLWTLMMPTFGSHDAKMMPDKMPKPQNEWKPLGRELSVLTGAARMVRCSRSGKRRGLVQKSERRVGNGGKNTLDRCMHACSQGGSARALGR